MAARLTKRSTARLTRTGILGELQQGMQRRLDALKRTRIRPKPELEDVKESEERWRTLRHQVGE